MWDLFELEFREFTSNDYSAICEESIWDDDVQFEIVLLQTVFERFQIIIVRLVIMHNVMVADENDERLDIQQKQIDHDDEIDEMQMSAEQLFELDELENVVQQQTKIYQVDVIDEMVDYV